MKIFVTFISGFIFALGLGLAGMTQPQKIISFLDFFGNWDPSLLLVMIGAISIHSVIYFFARKMQRPLISPKWHVPVVKPVTISLIVGSAIFGVGWGLAGYCPGPSIVSLISGQMSSLLFVLSMLCGMFVFRIFNFYLKLNR